jgi:hypothetical protein
LATNGRPSEAPSGYDGVVAVESPVGYEEKREDGKREER